MGTSPRPLPHIRELDAVRGLAALMVFFHHLCFTSIDPAAWGRGINLLYNISGWGAYGVDLFFVLSGFLITSLLIKDRVHTAYYRDFYWKRALRILPLYLLCLLGLLLFVRHSGSYVLLSALFISNFAWLFHVQATGPFWTLAIEEQFYLLWPTVVRRRSVSELRRWAVTIILGCILLRFIAAFFGHHNYFFTFFRCDGLAAGALLACWYERRQTTPPNTLSEHIAIGAAILTGTLIFVVTSLYSPSPDTNALFAALNQTAAALLCAGAIAFLIAHSGKPWLGLFRSPLLIFFGLISYAMYMTHIYILLAYDHLRGPLLPGNLVSFATRFFGVLALTILLCLLTRYLIELPAISLRRFVLTKPTPKAEIESTLLTQ
ncbi:peptidoglycan/LPS O-acetylase OafA/YrhL [Edaphobacter aggregans]|uniref:Peptidoglycan/LPS O-acetylase OafA/YrhL n=1 Tax=Edaphobacter aggregans TaxID=570835 RepID=A0A428MIR8_9BACT|nr:acyltransferase [Edaphobacter aggregans]RSL16831.1 peptidoglycan/LPS O-acetylase OafA/YrhL [Edaphobacter aggregans]